MVKDLTVTWKVWIWYSHHMYWLARKQTFMPLAFPFTAWRENFLQIEKLVLIGGPDDGVITPWQSRSRCLQLYSAHCSLSFTFYVWEVAHYVTLTRLFGKKWPIDFLLLAFDQSKKSGHEFWRNKIYCSAFLQFFSAACGSQSSTLCDVTLRCMSVLFNIGFKVEYLYSVALRSVRSHLQTHKQFLPLSHSSPHSPHRSEPRSE